ncbi:MAG: APC family permease [Pyrinomonadaceae bacterium]|nr:APC family permease [Pyrinomonadaceae bacterium]
MNLKRILFGNPIANEHAHHERLNKKTGLAVFSSDALSSTAYATEEILLVLAVAVAYGQANSFNYVVPISIAIGLLIWIVAFSYRQTIHAYPSGGGAYIVAKDNLGTNAGLTAAAALLVDYILTVAVSISAGVAAITSAVQGTRYEWLTGYTVHLCIGFIIFIAFANLRGVRESGTLFSIPTYGFVISFFLMILYGLFHYFAFGGEVPMPSGDEIKLAEGYAPQALTLFLILGAFSNGCSALTGIEAISNGVQAFKKPEAKNASTTLIWMAFLLSAMFLGTSVLAYLFHVHPHANETVISQFARVIFTGNLGWFYYVIQAFTAAILILAANTAFADFPRLSSLLANDRFLPRQFSNRGDKLVFTNGIVVLSVAAIILVIAFQGDTSKLIPLYAVGVFLSFTLSQSGMVKHWLREREKNGNGHNGKTDEEIHVSMADPQLALSEAKSRKSQAVEDEVTGSDKWLKSLILNAFGAVATAIVLVVFVITKFMHGAWLVVLIIPLLVWLFHSIHKHYLNVSQQLSTTGFEKLQPIKHEVIVPISGLHQGVLLALQYAKSISPDHVTAVFVDLDGESGEKLKTAWEKWNLGVKLEVLHSPFRSLTRPLLDYIDKVDHQADDDLLTVILPEFVPARWWHQILHNQSSLVLKGYLLFKKGIIVTNVPYHLKK